MEGRKARSEGSGHDRSGHEPSRPSEGYGAASPKFGRLLLAPAEANRYLTKLISLTK